MPALNFQKQFVASVESGEKCQTIRALRKDHRDPKMLDTLYLYTGMRTRDCRKLAEVKCSSSEFVSIEGFEGFGVWIDAEVIVSGQRVDDLDAFAQADGFKDASEMLAWFTKTHGLPFEGKLIKWQKGSS